MVRDSSNGSYPDKHAWDDHRGKAGAGVRGAGRAQGREGVVKAEDSVKLLRAATLLDEVRATLNVTAAPCGHCGLNVKANFAEAQLAQQLQGSAERLRRWAVPPVVAPEASMSPPPGNHSGEITGDDDSDAARRGGRSRREESPEEQCEGCGSRRLSGHRECPQCGRAYP